MNRESQGFHISHVYFLWQDLSLHTIIFDLVTLTLKFDLFFKNFNLGHILWIPCKKTFHTIPLFFTLTFNFESHILNVAI